MKGFEFLEFIRANDNWKHLKCFILTTSDEKTDRVRAKDLKISGYIVKPFKLNNAVTMDAFNLMIDLLNYKSREL
ncbi:MAG: response regulator [Minisyncoccia bacterium]